MLSELSITWLFYLWIIINEKQTTFVEKKSIPVKTESDSSNFDIAESEKDNQIALLPTSVTGEGIKL